MNRFDYESRRRWGGMNAWEWRAFFLILLAVAAVIGIVELIVWLG